MARTNTYKFYLIDSHRTTLMAYFLIPLFLLISSVNNPALANPTITSKTVFFLLYLSVLSVLLLFVLIIKKTTITLKFSKIDIGLLLFICFILCNRYFIQDHHGFSLRFIELQGLFILYVIMRFMPSNAFIYILSAIILSGSIQALYGILQSAGLFPSLNSNFGITGNFFNPGPYGGYLATIACISYSCYLFKEKLTTKLVSNFPNRQIKNEHKTRKYILTAFSYIALLGIITTIIVLPSTRSRAAGLAVIIPLVFLILYKYLQSSSPIKRKIKDVNIYLKITLSLFILVGIAVVLYKAYYFKKASADGRVLVWRVAGNIIHDNPIFGVGYDRFKAYYMDAQADYFTNETAQISKNNLYADNTFYAFNEVLLLISENGLVSLLIVAGIAIICLYTKVDKKYIFLKYISLSIIASIIIFGMFSYPSSILPIKIILIVFITLLANLDKKKICYPTKNYILQNKRWKTAIKIFVFTVSIIYTTGILYSTITLKKALTNWGSALVSYNKRYYQTSIGYFNKALPVLKKDGEFLMNYGKALALAGRFKKAKNILEEAKEYLNNTIIETTLGDCNKKLKLYREAEIAYTKAASMIPYRFYPQYCLAILYMDTGEKQKAFYKAKEILDKKIKVPSMAIGEIRTKMETIIKKLQLNKNNLPME